MEDRDRHRLRVAHLLAQLRAKCVVAVVLLDQAEQAVDHHRRCLQHHGVTRLLLELMPFTEQLVHVDVQPEQPFEVIVDAPHELHIGELVLECQQHDAGVICVVVPDEVPAPNPRISEDRIGVPVLGDHVLECALVELVVELDPLPNVLAVEVSDSTTSATALTWSSSRRFITRTPWDGRP